jgi:hypothetical protein
MDFPGQIPMPQIISLFSEWAAGRNQPGLGSISSAPVTWPAANRVIYVPFVLPSPVVARRLFWTNGSSLGNAQVGIYTRGGVRLCSSGIVAQSGSTVFQFVTLGTEVILDAGFYYFAAWNDGTTSRMGGSITPTANQGRLAGLLQEDLAGGAVLPATMTPATLTSFAYPLAGIVQNTATPH